MNPAKQFLENKFGVFALLLFASMSFVSCGDLNNGNVEMVSTSKFGLQFEIPNDWNPEVDSDSEDEITYFGKQAKDPVEGFISIRVHEYTDTAFVKKKDEFIDGYSEEFKNSDGNAIISTIQIDNQNGLSIILKSAHDTKAIDRKILIFYVHSKEYWIELNSYTKDAKKAKVVHDVFIESLKFK